MSWAFHLLNKVSNVDMEVIDSLSNRLLDALADYTTIFKVIKIIKQFSKSKPPKDDGIPAKIYKYI